MGAAATLWRKHMTKVVVHKEEAFGLLFQPILWVVLFGTGMKSVIGSELPGGGDSYITFMVPGIVALTAMSGAIEGGLMFLQERILGTVKEYLAAPIPRVSILLGNALSTVTKSLFQAIVILIVGVLMGAQLDLLPLGWLGGLVLVAAFALGFAGIGLSVASRTDSPGGYHMLIFMFSLPLLFLSSSLYPLASLPTWMRIAARVNPMSYVVDGVRQTAFQGSGALASGDFPLWLCFLVVALFAFLGIALAYFAFRQSIK